MKYVLLSIDDIEQIIENINIARECGFDEMIVVSNEVSPSEYRKMMALQNVSSPEEEMSVRILFGEFDTYLRGFDIVSNYLAAEDFFITTSQIGLKVSDVQEIKKRLSSEDSDVIVGLRQADAEEEKYVFAAKPILIASLHAVMLKEKHSFEPLETTVDSLIEAMKKDNLKLSTIEIK